MVAKQAKRSRALDIFLELGIAIGIAGLALLGAFFYAAYENARWMPSADTLKQGAWTLATTGFGFAYLYLAYSTRRLQRLVADKPQLQPLMALMDRWYIDAGIAAACFVVAIALFRRMLGERGGINVPAALQVVTGVVFVLGGMAVLRAGARLRPHAVQWKLLANPITTYVLAFAGLLYGAARIISGIYLFVK